MDETKMQALIEAAVEKRVAKLKLQMVPHNCHTCKWFILRKEKPRNRVCRCPDELQVKGNTCLNWKLNPNPDKVTGRLY